MKLLLPDVSQRSPTAVSAAREELCTCCEEVKPVRAWFYIDKETICFCTDCATYAKVILPMTKQVKAAALAAAQPAP